MHEGETKSAAPPRTREDLKIFIFAQKTDPGDGFAIAEAFYHEACAYGLGVQFIDRLSADFDDLLLVARRGVMSSPTVLVDSIDGRQHRLRRIPLLSEILAL